MYRRDEEIQWKRKTYWNLVKKYATRKSLPQVQQVEQQILLDLPRTTPRTQTAVHSFYKSAQWNQLAKNVLLIWSQQHPSVGFFQGSTDILLVIVDAFLTSELPSYATDTMAEDRFQNFEADCYWIFLAFMKNLESCLGFSNRGVEDAAKLTNSTTISTSISSKDNRLNKKVDYCEYVFRNGMDCISDIFQRVDPQLADHFKKQDVQMSYFALRWVLCAMSRELDLPIIQVPKKIFFLVSLP